MPKVSVAVVSYNQERYIGACLDSILSQQVEGGFEVIVADDASTDRTPEILRDYAARYPDLLRVVLHEKNLGPTQNYLFVHRATTAPFIAHMDGDDLMLPGKLQRQLDFMEANPGCTALWHGVLMFNDDRTQVSPGRDVSRDLVPSGRIEVRDLLLWGSLTFHCSMMYRRGVIDDLHVDGEILDYHVAIAAVEKGYGFYLPELLGEYRFNPGGGTYSTPANRASCVMQDRLAKHLEWYLEKYPQYRKEIFQHAVFAARSDYMNGRVSWKRYARLALKSFSLPGVLGFLDYRLRRLGRKMPPVEG